MPLRFPRPALALIATGAAAGVLALASGFGMAAAPAAVASSVRGSEWWLDALGLRHAWTTTRGAGITVAVLSDGVDASHPDLVGSVTSGPNLVTGAPASGAYFGELGTGLASIIAGHGEGSGIGVMGAAPRARILSVQVTLPAGDPLLYSPSVAAGLPGAIAAGIRYAVDHGASVIDLPLDPGQPAASGLSGASAAAGGSAAERSAIQYAVQHNVVLVAPAGDNGASTDAANYPAAYPGVIAVGAFDRSFVKAPWSSRQDYVTVTAAGVGITAAANDGGYQTLNSTSAASAVVSGIAALIRSRFPGLSAAQVRRALTVSTVFDTRTPGSGYGSVNAAAALTAAAAEAPSGPPAGAGGLPLATTQAPPPPAPHSLTHTLIRDGIISGGLLALLLLLIGALLTSRRRRAARREQAVTASWAGPQAPSRYPYASPRSSAQVAEFFAAPTLAPALPGAPSRSGQAVAPVPAVSPPADPSVAGPAAPGPFATRAPGFPQAVAGRTGGAAPSAAAAGPARSAGDPLSSPIPAAREVPQRPAVSGSPPWEPAVRPDSEFPWAAGPGRGPAGTRREPAVPYAASPLGHLGGQTGQRPAGVPGRARHASHTARKSWLAVPAETHASRTAAESSRRPDSALPIREPRQVSHLAPLSPTGSLWERAAEPAAETSDSQVRGSQPIYVWNPSASTDSPAASPDDSGQTESSGLINESR